MYPSHSRSHLASCCLDENINQALGNILQAYQRTSGTMVQTKKIIAPTFGKPLAVVWALKTSFLTHPPMFKIPYGFGFGIPGLEYVFSDPMIFVKKLKDVGPGEDTNY